MLWILETGDFCQSYIGRMHLAWERFSVLISISISRVTKHTKMWKYWNTVLPKNLKPIWVYRYGASCLVRNFHCNHMKPWCGFYVDAFYFKSIWTICVLVKEYRWQSRLMVTMMVIIKNKNQMIWKICNLKYIMRKGM